MTRSSTDIARKGWTLLPDCFTAEAMAAWASRLRDDFLQEEQSGVRERDGGVYAARNIFDIAPWIHEAWREAPLVDFVLTTLGPQAGLVRGLFFDKPPNQSWALPWHKDVLIAIEPTEVVPAGYSTPRLRAGVWHTEPPARVLETMVTLRIHLDAATVDNGPLEVLTGSHATGKEVATGSFAAETILCGAGDVLAMRPLLVHSSGRSREGTDQHRRIVHLEFAAEPELPGEVRWNLFEPVR